MVGVEDLEEFGQKFALGEAAVETEGDVLEHGHRLEQREMLEHHADAEPPGGAGIGDARRRSVENDLPLVGGENAVDHLDESRLAGAVLAEKGVDLAGPDAETDVVVGAHARKRLRDADEPQPRGSFDIHLDYHPAQSPRVARATRHGRNNRAATYLAPRFQPPERWIEDVQSPCGRRPTRQIRETLTRRAPVSNELAGTRRQYWAGGGRFDRGNPGLRS